MDELVYFLAGSVLPFVTNYLLPKRWAMPLSLFLTALSETRAGFSNKKDEK